MLVPFIRKRRSHWPAHRGRVAKADSRPPNLYGQQPCRRSAADGADCALTHSPIPGS
jgi:hypothetical protein